MKRYTTSQESSQYSIAMSDEQGNSFDNQDALGIRLVLVYIESGTGIALMNGQSIPYISPCLFCINEKEHLVISSDDGAVVKAIYFHPEIVNSYLDYDNIRSLPDDVPFTYRLDNDLIKFFWIRNTQGTCYFSLGPVSSKRVKLIFERVHVLIDEMTDPRWPCRSRSYVLELLFLLDNLYTEDDPTSQTSLGTISEEFSPVLHYVYENYEQKITVADIAERFHVSRTTLAKQFQENLGESFVAFLNRLRVNMAATMLRDTMLPVYDVMLRVGFHDNAHFLRTFKKVTGLPPSSYREKYNWM